MPSTDQRADGPALGPFRIFLAVLGGLFVALVVLLVILVISEGDDGATTTAAGATTTSSDAATTAPSTTAPTTSLGATTVETTTTTTTVPFAGDTSPKAGDGDFGLLAGVRFAGHEGYTRVVFDFREPAFPNWELAYVPGEIEGMAEPEGGWVEGTAFLVARFQPSGTADLSGPTVVMTYDGPRRIDVGIGSVVQLLIVEDFEANLWWAIGLTGEKAFSVGTLTGPPRIYVDITD